MSSIVATNGEDAQSKLQRVRRKTLSFISISDLKPIHRSHPRCDEEDETPSRPIWLDSDDEEEGLPERFIFTTKDAPKKEGSKRKSTKNSALLSPRVMDKENETASLYNSSSSTMAMHHRPTIVPSPCSSDARLMMDHHVSGMRIGETAGAHPQQRSQEARPEAAVPSSLASSACTSLAPIDWSDLPPPPEPRPTRPIAGAGPSPLHSLPPPPIPPRDYHVHYGLLDASDGATASRPRSRTYTDPSDLRKAGLQSASMYSLPALSPPIPIPQRPTAYVQLTTSDASIAFSRSTSSSSIIVRGTRSMYEISTVKRENDLTQSQPLCLTRSCQLDRHQQPSAKDIRRQEKLTKKQQKDLSKEKKKLEKRMRKERKKNERQGKKQRKESKESAFFIDSSPSLPSFDQETRVQLLL